VGREGFSAGRGGRGQGRTDRPGFAWHRQGWRGRGQIHTRRQDAIPRVEVVPNLAPNLEVEAAPQVTSKFKEILLIRTRGLLMIHLHGLASRVKVTLVWCRIVVLLQIEDQRVTSVGMTLLQTYQVISFALTVDLLVMWLGIVGGVKLVLCLRKLRETFLCVNLVLPFVLLS
jgi:hypothetical protein